MAKNVAREKAPVDGKGGGIRGSLAIPLALALAIGIAVGGGAGTFIAGPLLANRVVRDIDKVAEAAGSSYVEHLRVAGEAGSASDESGEGASTTVHTIENLVVNPARSNGTRYLLLSLSLAVGDEETAAEIERRDAEVRDAVIGMLGTKSVAELSDHESREALKTELGAIIDALLNRSAVRAVYFPQYVIH